MSFYVGSLGYPRRLDVGFGSQTPFLTGLHWRKWNPLAWGLQVAIWRGRLPTSSLIIPLHPSHGQTRVSANVRECDQEPRGGTSPITEVRSAPMSCRPLSERLASAESSTREPPNASGLGLRSDQLVVKTSEGVLDGPFLLRF